MVWCAAKIGECKCQIRVGQVPCRIDWFFSKKVQKLIASESDSHHLSARYHVLRHGKSIVIVAEYWLSAALKCLVLCRH